MCGIYDNVSPQLRQYRERRQYYIFLMGNRCWKCKRLDGLEFDHVDPSTKVATISSLLASSAPIDVLETELKKCQLLCEACHQEKTLLENGRAQHGTGGMYKHHGCRCEFCLEYNRNYMREYYRRKMEIDPTYRQQRRWEARRRQQGISQVGEGIGL